MRRARPFPCIMPCHAAEKQHLLAAAAMAATYLSVSSAAATLAKP